MALSPATPAADRGLTQIPPHQWEYLQLILLAVMVGLLAALGNLGFRELIDGVSRLFQTRAGGMLHVHSGLGRLWLPLILVSGGCVLLILDYFYPGDVLGYGFPNFLETVNLGNARLRRRWIFLKGIGAALSLGCGASVGREGPIAQVGGAIGSALARLRKLSTGRAKVLVAAGAGAGIATTFNAPMGGMMFAQEIVLLGETELANLTLVLVATFSAVVLSRALTGADPIFHPGTFVIDNYSEMVTYGVMGLIFGVLSAAYIRFFHGAGRIIRSFKIKPWQRLLAGLALVGVIAIPLPQNLADGYPVIEQALQGRLALDLTIALTVAKFVASTISLNVGAPGGIFGPVFFIGAMAGASFRGAAHWIAPGLTGPAGSYALVGLGAFLSGVTHAPLTALLLLFEMTRGDWTVVLPAMISSIGALIVARSIEHESIDTYSLALEGKNLEIGRDRLVLTQLPVSSVVRRNTQTVRSDAPLAEVMRVAGETSQATLPVLNRDGGLTGLIVTRDLLSLLASSAELGSLANAWDLSRQNPPLLTLSSNLDQAAQLMEYEGLDELPVVDKVRGGAYLGLVARHDIARAFNRVSLSVSALATRDTNIFWASGYRVSRMRVPVGAVGRTLRELDARTRFGVSVLAVQDNPDDGFVPSSPERQFKPDDLIIAAGSSAALRRFARELEQPAPSTAPAAAKG
jgi:CIC family chloride channel protein